MAFTPIVGIVVTIQIRLLSFFVCLFIVVYYHDYVLYQFHYLYKKSITCLITHRLITFLE